MSRFFDVHVHPPVRELIEGSFAPFVSSLESVFGRTFGVMEDDELADYYRSRDGRGVLLAWDATTATGAPALSNRRVAALVDAYPDLFVGFGSVDPHRGAAAISSVHEAARLGLKGLKFHPAAQRFSPNEHEYFTIWETAQELGLVCLFHTGVTALGSGMPGGGGVRQRHAHPLLLDDVAAEFPGLQIILAHPSWPWQEDALAIAQHKPNVYLELSGLSPHRFGESLLAAATGPLQDRTLFGSDFPFLTPDTWLREWEALGIEAAVSRKILVDNAEALLGG